MESTELWDIKSSEGYIYAAFKIKSEDGTSEDWKWSRIWVRTDLDAFPPWHAASGFLTNSRPVYDFIPSF